MADFIIAEKNMTDIFNGCLGYLNANLKVAKNIELDIEFYMETEKQNIYAKAGKREDGRYIVTVSMATYSIVEAYYTEMLRLKGFYMGLTNEKDYDIKIVDQYSIALIDMTIRTIIYHELGHIFNGHIDYIQFKIDEYKRTHPDKKNINYVAEYLENCKTARPYLEAMDWQALEWNADDFAITRLIAQFTHKENMELNNFKSIDQVFFVITAAITSMHCLMDMHIVKDDDVMDKYTLQEHLPKRYRLQNYLKVAGLATKKFNGMNIDFYNEPQFEKVVRRFEEWYVVYTKAKSGEMKEGDKLDITDTTVENNREELDEDHEVYYLLVDLYYLAELPRELKDFTYCEVYDNFANKDEEALKATFDKESIKKFADEIMRSYKENRSRSD